MRSTCRCIQLPCLRRSRRISKAHPLHQLNRLLRTNLMESDITPIKEEIAQSLFDHIPVGVGSKGVIPTTAQDLDEVHYCYLT